MDEAMVFWLQDPEPAKWHGRSPFVRQPAYSIAQDRIRELEAENARLNLEMIAYREKLTPADAAAMVSVINSLHAGKAARPLPHATWFDGGYLNNGHCSFMWARNGAGACCNLPHGHEGSHRDDSDERR